ncbi:MAG: diacylglycerol kinase catalytic region [Candidatus Saccharibacteria bacterium]|nr:diacylglycerol kinase catalytic region [Candidatus Saccharibacteria bacterium]
MKQIKAELIINTSSRRGRAAVPIIIAACKHNGIELVKINFLKKDTNLRAVTSALKKRNPSLVLVGGGDGTISDAVDFFAGSSIQLGVIPLGTTNNFARSLGLPLEIEAAIGAVKNGKISNVDLGKIHKEYFVNVAGVGVSALIAKHVTDDQKKKFGRFAYAINGIVQLIRHKPFLATIEDKDSELQLHFETHQIIIANGRYHAGKQIAKDAKIDNRELIIFALGGRSKLSFIFAMADFYFGARKNIQHASYLTGHSIKLRTNTPQLVELDGEVKFTTPIPVEVTPRVVKVRH